MEMLLPYLVKIAVCTLIIYPIIFIMDTKKRKNQLVTALLIAVVMTGAGINPFLFFLALAAFIVVLIKFYGAKPFKSVLIGIFFAVLFFLIHLILSVGLVDGKLEFSRIDMKQIMSNQMIEARRSIRDASINFPAPIRNWIGIIDGEMVDSIGGAVPVMKEYRIIMTRDRRIDAMILVEGTKGYLVDIANGKSEVVVRKDDVIRIEPLQD